MSFLISIICPLYNKELYIEETIVSVINQSFENWELIIVDDGSTDSSINIVTPYISNRIKLYHRKDYKGNKGGSVCRNIGIEKSEGDFILFLDADDLLKKDSLAKRIEYVKKHPDYGFYIFDIVHFRETTDNLRKKRFKKTIDFLEYNLSRNKRKFFIKRFLIYDNPWSICNTLWKKKTLVEIGGFDETFQRLQDPEIHTRALLREDIKYNFAKFDVEPDVLVRNDEDRKSNFSDLEIFKNVLISIEHFILSFIKIIRNSEISENEKKKYYNYLSCYAFLVEQMYSGYKRKDSENKYEYRASLSRFKTNPQIQVIYNSRYHLFERLYKLLAVPKIFRKMRIPSLFVYFYKKSR